MIDREHRAVIMSALSAALKIAKAESASAEIMAASCLGGTKAQARKRATTARDRLVRLRAAYAAVSDEQVHENTARIHLTEITRWHGQHGYRSAGEYAIAPASGQARQEWAAKQLEESIDSARAYLEGRG